MSNVAGLVRVKDGELLVCTKALSDGWATYDTHTNPPTPSRITKALGSICSDEKAYRLGKRTQRYRTVNTQTLIAWAESNGYATREEILDALSKDTKVKDSEDTKPYDSLLGKQGGLA
jgi:hypothetical protein